MSDHEEQFKSKIIKDKNKIVGILVVSAIILFIVMLLVIGYIIIKINS